MPGKYHLLEVYLKSLPLEEKQERLSFQSIETIIKSKLPESAGELSWWEHETEGNHRNTRAWANAGWQVDEVNFREKWVRFKRAR